MIVGGSISSKNPNFCELTGLYWIWKNGLESQNDIVGLIHYRRGFTNKKSNIIYSLGGKVPENIEYEKFKVILKKYDMVVPIPEKGFKTVYQTYSKMHNEEDLILTRKVISDLYPEYLRAFDYAMNAHYYFNGNMFVTRKEMLDQYADWLFSIYKQLEKLIDLNKYENTYQSRVYGFISERLLNVWLVFNKVNYKKMPMFNTEIRSLNSLTRNIKRVKKFINRH